MSTFIGAWVAALAAATHKMKFALVIGVFFLAGGIASVWVPPSPVWFVVVDLTIAYLPMAYLAELLATRMRGRTAVLAA